MYEVVAVDDDGYVIVVRPGDGVPVVWRSVDSRVSWIRGMHLDALLRQKYAPIRNCGGGGFDAGR